MTTIITPILLKVVFKRFAPPVSAAQAAADEHITEAESMAGRYEERERYHMGGHLDGPVK